MKQFRLLSEAILDGKTGGALRHKDKSDGRFRGAAELKGKTESLQLHYNFHFSCVRWLRDALLIYVRWRFAFYISFKCSI